MGNAEPGLHDTVTRVQAQHEEAPTTGHWMRIPQSLKLSHYPPQQVPAVGTGTSAARLRFGSAALCVVASTHSFTSAQSGLQDRSCIRRQATAPFGFRRTQGIEVAGTGSCNFGLSQMLRKVAYCQDSCHCH